MAFNVAERIDKLNVAVQPVTPDDLMAEAGRKILLAEFVKMMQNEAGSRTGEDIESVHDMRVAIRKMRSLFRLLSPYYKRTSISPYKTELQHLAWTLGAVRDLDVLIEDIRVYQLTLKAAKQADLQQALQRLPRRCEALRRSLAGVSR